MKKIVLIISLAFISHYSYSQDQNIDPTNYLNYYRISKSRINFYHVNDKYEIQPDTIYYIERPDFTINIGWDSIMVGTDWYMIITYPDYKKGKQYTPPYRTTSLIELRDSLYLEYNKSNVKKEKLKSIGLAIEDVNKKIQDSLSNLVAAVKKAGANAAVVQGAAPPSNDDLIKNSSAWTRKPLLGINGLKLLIKRDDLYALDKVPVYSTKWNKVAFASGQLTVPFKLRPSTQDKAFSMTTDVTLGAYAGVRRRLSSTQKFFVTVPVLLGLTFVNVNDNTTTTTSSTASGVYPGWTLATGFVFELNSVNIGIVTGWDFASQVGKGWIYQGKNWVSFAIGYSFLK